MQKNNLDFKKLVDQLGKGGALEFLVRMALEYVTFPTGYGPGDLLTLIEGVRDLNNKKKRGYVKILAAVLPFVPSVVVAMGIEKLFL